MNITKSLYQISQQAGVDASRLRYYAEQLFGRTVGDFTKEQEEMLLSKINPQTTSQMNGRSDSRTNCPNSQKTSSFKKTPGLNALNLADPNTVDSMLQDYKKLTFLQRQGIIERLVSIFEQEAEEERRAINERVQNQLLVYDNIISSGVDVI